MKSICLILIAAMAIHAACAVQCLAVALDSVSHQPATTSEKPPCHEQPSDNPASPHDQHSSQHEKSNACGVPQTDSAIALTSKFVTHTAVMELPAAPILLEALAATFFHVIARNGTPPSPPPVQV